MKNNFQNLSSTTQAILFMITTLFMFSIMDLIAKYLNDSYDTFQIVWARYTSQFVLAFFFSGTKINSVIKNKIYKITTYQINLFICRYMFIFQWNLSGWISQIGCYICYKSLNYYYSCSIIFKRTCWH